MYQKVEVAYTLKWREYKLFKKMEGVYRSHFLCLFLPTNLKIIQIKMEGDPADLRMSESKATGDIELSLPATSGGAPAPPERRLPNSPVREHGFPPRSNRVVFAAGPTGSRTTSGGRHGERREKQVSSPRQWWTQGWTSNPSKPRAHAESREEDEIQAYWGQLWFFPKSNPRIRVSGGGERKPSLDPSRSMGF